MLLFVLDYSGTPDRLLRRYAVQNSKCRFWCCLRGSAPFISPLNWTELGLNAISVCRRFGRMTGYSSGIGLGKSCRQSARNHHGREQLCVGKTKSLLTKSLLKLIAYGRIGRFRVFGSLGEDDAVAVTTLAFSYRKC